MTGTKKKSKKPIPMHKGGFMAVIMGKNKGK